MPDAPTPAGLIRAVLGAVAIGCVVILGGGALQWLFGNPGENPPVEAMAPPASTETAPSSASATDSETADNAEPAPPEPEAIAPEPPTPSVSADAGSDLFIVEGQQGPVYARDYMMVAAHPVASQVGAAVLDDGGSAIDAIIAAQLVLNLVEPQSSGIGGGGFLLYWDEAGQELFSYDGRETAPEDGSGDYVRDENGEFRSFADALTGGASVGVPGLLRMLEMAHRDHGSTPWTTLFGPAIELAENGFPVSVRLHGLLGDTPYLNEIEPAASYFYDEAGTPHPVGTVLTNPDLAATFREISVSGADAFYEGEIAADIAAAVQGAERNPGALTTQDMARYEAVRRGNLCLHYRIYRVCGMPPPSSGVSTVLHILGLLEYSDRNIGDYGPMTLDAARLFGEAMRLAFADRNQFVADSDFVSVPLAEMLAVPYLARRAGTMDFSHATKPPRRPGNPTGDRAFLDLAPDLTPELPSTTHLVAVDRNGNVASMTSSIENGFGSRLMVRGFLLNNQLTDFAWSDTREGRPVANRYEPLKRPRSSMAPTIVFGPDGAPRLAIGSPGGSRIIGYVAQALVGVLDWDLSIQEAIDLPHYLNRNGAMELEDHTQLDRLEPLLSEQGYEVQRRAMTSGLHGVELAGGFLIGGADPRREGLAVGEGNLTRDLNAVFQSLIGTTD
ncbi:MAG: gamma-glutamyltransferase family protein [Alphaproteobacteria bacterium]